MTHGAGPAFGPVPVGLGEPPDGAARGAAARATELGCGLRRGDHQVPTSGGPARPGRLARRVAQDRSGRMDAFYQAPGPLGCRPSLTGLPGLGDWPGALSPARRCPVPCGRFAARSLVGGGGRQRCRGETVRVLRARAVLRDPLRLLRLQHLHRHRARRRCAPRRRTPRPRSPRSGWPAGVLGDAATGRCATVFFGGGTPTLLPPADLAGCSRAIGDEFGLAAGRRGDDRGEPGVGRPRRPRRAARGAASPGSAFGMQSAAPHVLSDARPHAHARPGRRRRSQEARAAGFEHVSLDLIYGTPGESRRRLAGLAGGGARRAARTTSRPTR